jgi:hypothetical protein
MRAESPIDVLSARLDQLRGAVAAVAHSYDDDQKQFTLPADKMHSALWGVEELLDQAIAAFNAVLDEEIAETRNKAA